MHTHGVFLEPSLLKKVGLFFLALLFIVATRAFILLPLPCFVDEHVKQMGAASRNYFVSVQDSNNYFLTSDPPGKLFGTTISPLRHLVKVWGRRIRPQRTPCEGGAPLIRNDLIRAHARTRRREPDADAVRAWFGQGWDKGGSTPSTALQCARGECLTQSRLLFLAPRFDSFFCLRMRTGAVPDCIPPSHSCICTPLHYPFDYQAFKRAADPISPPRASKGSHCVPHHTPGP